jgi:hypothetical protein
VYLVDHRDERGVCSVAKENTQRIKAIAERARHAEKMNPAAINIDMRLAELLLDLSSQRRSGSVAVIGVIQTENIRPVIGKPSQLSGKFDEIVKIDQ